MGAAASQQLEDGLRDARCKAESEGKDQVEDILFNDDEFVKVLLAVWDDLDPERKKQFKSCHVNDKVLSKSITELSLPTKVLEQLLSWKAQPDTFLEIDRNSQLERTHIFVQVYVLICNLENDYIINQIRRRILLFILYRVKFKLASGSRLTPVQWPRLLSLVVQSRFVDDKNSIEKNLTKWTSAGARYSTFADELNGIGSLVLLPFHISSFQWEREITIKGPKHEEMVRSLKQKGICEEARREISRPNLSTTIHEIATELYEYVWKEFDGPLWLDTVPGSSLGLLAAAAKSVSSGLCPSLKESAVESSQQGNTTAFNIQNHAQQANQHYIDNIGPTFHTQQITQPYIDPTIHAAQRYHGNNIDPVSDTQQAIQPFIDPTIHAAQGYHRNNIGPTFHAHENSTTPSNLSIIGQSEDFLYAQRNNFNNVEQTEDITMLCGSSSYTHLSPYFAPVSQS